MTRFAYPTTAMMGDYARAAAGLVPTVALLAMMPTGMAGGVVLGGFSLLFAVFGIRTALRHGTRVEMSEEALLTSGLLPSSILWRQLDRMKLSYYSTRRDRRAGWMQLELRCGRSRVCIDSRIDGFTELVRASARAAQTRGLPLDAATLANLEALGVKQQATDNALEEAAEGAA
jgi:hypothetical protein